MDNDHLTEIPPLLANPNFNNRTLNLNLLSTFVLFPFFLNLIIDSIKLLFFFFFLIFNDSTMRRLRPELTISRTGYGGTIPKHLIGIKDSNFYNHYYEIVATVEANWDLRSFI